MNKEQLILTLSKLGNFLHSFHTFDDSSSIIELTKAKNPWFTEEATSTALKHWSNSLQVESLLKWSQAYTWAEKPKTVGLIMAGNIPLVGLHDLLSVLISGHKTQVKLSSKDEVLMKKVIDFLIKEQPELADRITCTERLTNLDAAIVTGSNTTAQYFKTYFKEIPHIIRQNRTSVAVLDGQESPEEIQALAQDLFTYFGLGCRNVTKLFLPKGYSLNILFESFYAYKELINHHKYANNYDYYQTIYLMNLVPFFENGFAILKEDPGYFSPVAVAYFEFYSDTKKLSEKLKNDQEQIQCVVTHMDLDLSTVPFGKAQAPNLTDYADGVNTLAFLDKI